MLFEIFEYVSRDMKLRRKDVKKKRKKEQKEIGLKTYKYPAITITIIETLAT